MSNTENNEEPGAVGHSLFITTSLLCLQRIASFSGDLSSLTAPPFILSPVSLTEFPAYWCERPELFAAISSGKNEEERALLVLKWFISTLKGQYSSRNEKMGSEKKPLNPVLGEVFFGTWPDRDGRGETRLIVEQVSHHPPVTAYHIQNASKGVTLQGHSAQKTSFSGGSIVVKQIGHAILDVKLESGVSEKYLITLPTLNIQGVWLGSPYTELGGSSVIQSSSGWNASIEYKGKGYFSGKVHSFKATLSHPHSHHHPHVVEGQWSTTSTPKTNISSSRVLERNGCFTDVNGPKEEVTVKSIEEQGPWESRNLWKVVSAGIRTGDFDTAAKDKSRIENEQRQRRKDEREAGTSWDLLYFDHVDEDPIYEKLAAMGQIVPATEDGYILKDAPLPHPPR